MNWLLKLFKKKPLTLEDYFNNGELFIGSAGVAYGTSEVIECWKKASRNIVWINNDGTERTIDKIIISDFPFERIDTYFAKPTNEVVDMVIGLHFSFNDYGIHITTSMDNAAIDFPFSKAGCKSRRINLERRKGVRRLNIADRDR